MAVNSIPRILFFSVSLPNIGVPTIDQIRRDNLKLLVKEAGGTVDGLAKKLVKSASQVSQWLNASKDSKTGKPRNVSTESARALELKCGKPLGWMDQPHAEDEETTMAVAGPPVKGAMFDAPNEDEMEFLRDFRQLEDSVRARYVSEIADQAERMRTYLAKHMSKFGLPMPTSKAAQADKAARTAVEAAQKQLFDEKGPKR